MLFVLFVPTHILQTFDNAHTLAQVGASQATLLAKLGIRPFSYGLVLHHVRAVVNSATGFRHLQFSKRSEQLVDCPGIVCKRDLFNHI